MTFLGIISWKGVSCLNGEFVFQMGGEGGFISKVGEGHPIGSIGFGGDGFENNRNMGKRPPCPPPTMGNTDVGGSSTFQTFNI